MYHKIFSFICIMSILLCSSVEAMKRSQEKGAQTYVRVERDDDKQSYSKVIFYQCNEPGCDFTARLDVMRIHTIRHSNPDIYPQCPFCHFLATNEAGLKKHTTDMHPDENTNRETCSICGVSGKDLSGHYIKFHKPLFSQMPIHSKPKHNNSFPYLANNNDVQ